jgi:Asp-tRNA(Asn)/Glu-tRNA(Gln) amidotransferase A subunit family amidase
VIVGKTVTTELAFLAPGPTRNPLDLARTPGGSSSGSAAAVAAGMAPAAIGTQTNGSLIRPASFCGVYGFKPSHGLIPRTGVLIQSRPLDTIGVFGRSVEDVALVADAIAGHDGADPDAAPAAPPQLLETATSKPPVPPDFAFVKSPFWDRATPETHAGMTELAAALGKRCAEIALPDMFAEAAPLHRAMHFTGMARHLSGYEAKGGDGLSEAMRQALEEGRQAKAVDYLRAQDMREALNAGLEQVLNRFDAIITPAVIGEAPAGLQSTGDPIFCTIWSFCGVPAITLPLLEGPSGLPVGVQLVGRRGDDGRLLRTARWLVEYVAGLPGGERRAD